MKVESKQITRLKLTGLDALDPVTVIIEDTGLEAGKIIIECFGKSWTAYWGAMGEGGLARFFCGCDNDYILRKMLSETHETDFDKILERASREGYDICATNEVELSMLSGDMAKCFGDDWYMDLPRCRTSDYVYLSRIIDAVKEALT